MKRLFSLTGVITLAIIGLIFLAGCESSSQEAPLQPETEAPIVSPGLPPDLPRSDQPPPGERWNPDGVLGDSEYLGEMKYGDYEIRWMADGEYAYFGIRARTTGWVSVGFNPSSGMKDADMILVLSKTEQLKSMIYTVLEISGHTHRIQNLVVQMIFLCTVAEKRMGSLQLNSSGFLTLTMNMTSLSLKE